MPFSVPYSYNSFLDFSQEKISLISEYDHSFNTISSSFILSLLL